MPIPTEPIGSIPRPDELLDAVAAYQKGELARGELDAAYATAVRDTIEQFERTGSPVISDGEQSKPSFATYPIDGLDNLAPDGISIPFEDGHNRQLPRLTRGPFAYKTYAGSYLKLAKQYAQRPLKQSVIAASALSLIYPEEGIAGYPQDTFTEDLVKSAVADIRSCLDAGAERVQIDFTEGRLAVKLDPSKQLLRRFVTLNNRVLAHFSDVERARIGIHTCPGADQDAAHSADVDYAELLPDLFQINVGNFYMTLAAEKDPEHVLAIVREHLGAGKNVFVGVIDVNDPRVESAEEVCERVLLAARYIPLGQLGSTDDCGFSPFGDDRSTARKVAFDKIRARVEGTRLAAQKLGVA
ncbi:MAG: 5-methyltetrahydropteroyltriglutamate--homocysteine methyltransferase [Rhodanobacter sp.]|nr:MAG: 5-methyltetrahydropteroyltriglutamate--homocysteine methyltransferase [Rhodanobacter sp.]TAM01071.1 MAG: 5-methyltetrahydropteroyltriglutamate--homocysteine methyltransferase [Rhodanobacter sp.]TAM39937.1 MAG: 5-methyltetrahydropteroyltriglutamate--homocysteine methyltransferase [Rhodanobacter sp.]